MDVGIDQAGQHELADKVDDLRLWPDQRRHIGVGTDGDNGVAGEGKRLPDRARGVSRSSAPAPADESHASRARIGPAAIKPLQRRDTPASLVPAYFRPSRTSLASLIRAAR